MVNRVCPCRKIISPCKAQAGCGFVAIAEVGCTRLLGNDRLLGVNNGARLQGNRIKPFASENLVAKSWCRVKGNRIKPSASEKSNPQGSGEF